MSSVYSNYIKRMRMCANENCKGCTYAYEGLTNTEYCKEDLLYDAAEQLEDADKCNARLVKKCKEMEKRIAEIEAQLPKEGEWIMDENPHDGDCRCSVCLVAIDAMHERNHGLLNALTGGKWWKFYRFCPNCGARMKGENDGADC